jgi:putative ABC transport system permease protein
MNRIALQMLIGDRAKYLGIVFGVSFASLLMNQQAAIFCGLMLNTASQILDVREADVWVMAPRSRHSDDIRPIGENDLRRVRGVPGVEWAAKLHKNQAQARLPDGRFEAVILMGCDDQSLAGAPQKMVVGRAEDLRKPNAAVVDTYGFRYLFPDTPYRTGDTFEMNDRRIEVVGICDSLPPFMTLPVVFTRYAEAIKCVGPQRRQLSYVLVKADAGVEPADLRTRIEGATGLSAMTRTEFAWSTVNYYLERTGIPINFGITIVLGFIVGIAIAGQTFYLFVLENLRQFGMLKAMGVGNLTLARMVLIQAALVGGIGYGIGVGLAVVADAIITATITSVAPVFFLPWQVLAVTATAVGLIVSGAGLFALKRITALEPAMVFK